MTTGRGWSFLCRRTMPSVASLIIVSMTDISMSDTPHMSANCVVEVLEKCDNFADALKLIVSDLRQQGITQKSLTSFPRSELLEIMGKVMPQRNELSVQELHIYLLNKLKVEASNLCCFGIKMPTHNDLKRSLEDIIQTAEDNYKIVKAKKACLFGASLAYGQWLEMLHIKLKRDKTACRKNITFKKILKDKIGISDSYARQLRGLSKKFKSYSKFYYLSISISEFWQKRNQNRGNAY